jgi:alcohol dehydrogenase class IV
MDSSINYLKQEKKDTGIPLIAIPTTAGTGSESTKHAVIYYEGKKQSISHPSIVPDIAILEPSSLKTLPVYQKKCTMLDALCQGIESWWSVNSNDESIGYSKKAVQMIIDNWKAYIFDNTDEAAVKIMEAANYAGRAINITATTAAHAMSYKITSMYNLPHGHAVAVCMPEVWGYMLDHTDDCIDSRGADYLRNTLSDISEMFSLDSFKQLMTDLAMEYPVSTNKDADVNLLTESVNPVRLKNNPVALESKVLHEMYERIVR